MRHAEAIGRQPSEVCDGLAVVEHDATELGRVAAELLFARVDGFDGPPQQIVLAPRLVARGLGELPAPVAAA